MRATRCCLASLVVLPVMACASGGGAARPTTARWNGTLKQPVMAGSAVISAQTAQARAAGYGTAVLTPVPTDEGRTRVELSITAPTQRGTQVAWAVFPGSCSAATPPVIAATEFPLIDVANSGTGLVRTHLAMRLDPRSTYHVKVYSSSRVTDVSDVMMCAPLSFSGPPRS